VSDPTATTAVRQHHPAQDSGLAGVIATALPLTIVLVALVWLAKPWKRSNLPRARVIVPPRDTDEP
jgi:hypothetical protein